MKTEKIERKGAREKKKTGEGERIREGGEEEKKKKRREVQRGEERGGEMPARDLNLTSKQTHTHSLNSHTHVLRQREVCVCIQVCESK